MLFAQTETNADPKLFTVSNAFGCGYMHRDSCSSLTQPGLEAYSGLLVALEWLREWRQYHIMIEMNCLQVIQT